MKEILMSIRPQWCEKIFNGSKTIEVRKSRPSIPTPFKVYVYQTKHNGGKAIVSEVLNSVYGGGKVIGSFVCDRVRLCIPFGLKGHLLSQEVYREMCLTKEQLDKYGGLKTLYGWHITEPKLFEKPRELGEFYTKCDKKGDETCGDCLYLRVMLNSYPCDDSVDTWCGVDNKKPISRPPQSWCYVEAYRDDGGDHDTHYGI